MKTFIKSVFNAWSGIKHAISTEKHIRIHLTVALLVLLVSAFLSLSTVEWLIIIVIIGLVISLEMVNTAIEKTVDLVTTDYHPLAKVAKDIAAGAVFISAIISIIIGCIIFIPKLITLIGGL